MPSACREQYGFRRTSATEVKSGFLVFLGPSGMRQDVRVVVYKTSLEHFAVICPRKRVAKPIGVVNLRNTSVEQAEKCGFVVRQKGYDNTVSAKFMCSERDVGSWLAAFTARETPGAHHPAAAVSCLPVLVEAEES